MATQNTSLLPGLDMISQWLTQQAKKKTIADYNEKIASIANAKDSIELGNLMTEHMKAIQTDTFLDPQEQNMLVQNLGQQASVRGNQIKQIEEDQSANQMFNLSSKMNEGATYSIGGNEYTNAQVVEDLKNQGFTKPQDLMKAYEIMSQNKTQTMTDVSLIDRNKGTFQGTVTRYDPVTKKAFATKTGIIKNYGTNPYMDLNNDGSMQPDEQLDAISSRDFSKEKETWYKDQNQEKRENRIEAKQDEQIKLAKVQNWTTRDGDVVAGYMKSNGNGGIAVFSLGGFNITGNIKGPASPYALPKDVSSQDFTTASRMYNKSALKLKEYVNLNADVLPGVSKDDVEYNAKEGAIAVIGNNFTQHMGQIKTDIANQIQNSKEIAEGQKAYFLGTSPTDPGALWSSSLDENDIAQLKSLHIIPDDKQAELLSNWQDYKNSEKFYDDVTGAYIKKRLRGPTPSVQTQSLNVDDLFNK